MTIGLTDINKAYKDQLVITFMLDTIQIDYNLGTCCKLKGKREADTDLTVLFSLLQTRYVLPAGWRRYKI